MNLFVKSGLVTLCLVAVIGCSGKKKEVKEGFGHVTIPLGDYRMASGEYVAYNGMTGDNQRFLLSRFINSATNIYYPIEKSEIIIVNNKFKIRFVTPDSIGLTYLGRADEK